MVPEDQIQFFTGEGERHRRSACPDPFAEGIEFLQRRGHLLRTGLRRFDGDILGRGVFLDHLAEIILCRDNTKDHQGDADAHGEEAPKTATDAPETASGFAWRGSDGRVLRIRLGSLGVKRRRRVVHGDAKTDSVYRNRLAMPKKIRGGERIAPLGCPPISKPPLATTRSSSMLFPPTRRDFPHG